MACLDTTVLIDLRRRPGSEGHRAATRLLQELVADGETITTTRFNVAEMLAGVERHTDPLAARRKLDQLLERMVILDFSESACERFGKIAAHLARRGTPIGEMDILIAATAQVNGHMICTRNLSHYRQIQGLRLRGY